MKVCVAYSGAGLDDGYEGIVAHIVDEAAASARYEEVDFAPGLQEGVGCFVTAFHEHGGIGGRACGVKSVAYDFYGFGVASGSLVAAFEHASAASLEA